MRGIEDIGELERERRRPGPLLLVRAGGRSDSAQYQQHRPALEIAGPKYDDRVVGELAIGDEAVRLVVLRREIIPECVRRSDDRFIARSAAIARPDHIDLNQL